ncbi:hypothetical protein [Thermococcus thermotolerans]|uniref:hypothetical protein n=1 Tax=Thermococcus thermotolerans TaxID=2969672 RepID=UPI0021588E42|nr:hypothetical protein [Thermococcus thermotolerans]
MVVVLATLVIVAPFVEADFDPPGQPAVQVNVYFIGMSLSEDMDDGANGYADIIGTYKVTHSGHSTKDGKIDMFYYDWDTLKGQNGYIKKRLLYSHKECSPLKPITVEVSMEEHNTIFSNTQLGSGSITVTKPGVYEIKLDKGKALIEVKVTPAVLYSEKCSYFYDQPSSYASSLVSSSGGYIYDWQLANMINMWIANRTGYANMVFIFNQCFGGGMIDDLKEKLKGTGDAAFLSASKHDEPAWGLADGYTPASWPEMGKRGFKKPEGYYPKEVGEELARTGKDAPTMKEIAKRAEQQDSRGPYGLGFKETPQYTSIGNGDSIKIGKKADGSDVASKHAILFAGDANRRRHWNNLQRMYDALKKQGFTDGDIIVLAGDGKTTPWGSSVPNYVDGLGTKKALYEAIVNVSKKMNKNEQLVFWVSDHGNRERIELSMLKDIVDPVKIPVPPKKTAKSPEQISWDLDEEFLEVLRMSPDNQPYVSILVEATPEVMEYGEKMFGNVVLYVNGKRLELAFVEPIIAYDGEPDLDAFELVYYVDEGILGEENLVEVGWSGDPEMFIKYSITGLMISTGGVNEFEYPGDEDVPRYEPTLFDRLRDYVDVYNENLEEMPGFIGMLAGNERIALEIALDNGSVLNIGIVTSDGRITEFSEGKLEDPTLRVWTDESTVNAILDSDDPAGSAFYALKRGHIRYSGVGTIKKLRVAGVKVIVRIYRIAEVIGDIVG